MGRSPGTVECVPEEAAVEYVVVRHAPVRDDPDVCWVAIARWKYPDGSIQWCLEYWNAQGEADRDAAVPDEPSAVELAQREFGITLCRLAAWTSTVAPT